MGAGQGRPGRGGLWGQQFTPPPSQQGTHLDLATSPGPGRTAWLPHLRPRHQQSPGLGATQATSSPPVGTGARLGVGSSQAKLSPQLWR